MPNPTVGTTGEFDKETLKKIYDWFLPPGHRLPMLTPPVKLGPPTPPPPPPKKTGVKKPAKPHSAPPSPGPTPNPIDQYRALGQYGYNLIDGIVRDYDAQIAKWKIAFSEVVTAFATAVDQRNQTLTKAKRESERDAAYDAFVLSLATAGAMRFLGNYLQYDVMARSFPSKGFVYKNAQFGDLKIQVATPLPPLEFSRAQAALVGGLVQDAGNKTIPYVVPLPKVSYELSSWAGVENLRADFLKLLEESQQSVIRQFGAAQAWMNQHPDFGAAWLTVAGGNVELARVMILQQFESIRWTWVALWEFYGKEPYPITRALLANTFERALWAGFLLNVFGEWNDQSYHQRGHRLIQGRVVQEAIVDRLKQLNVVLAETKTGSADQQEKTRQGDPAPLVKIKDELDDLGELRALEGWAKRLMQGARSDILRQFFPPAKQRALPSLAAASYGAVKTP